MVLWEITLGTAYFLGLKRTYKLVLKLQRRLISPNHPKIRQFLHRRTRAVFDIALRVHRNIQQRDLEVGRNLGNWILRWLDRMKPAAQIRGCPSPPVKPSNGGNTTKHIANSSVKQPPRTIQRSNIKNTDQESDKHFFNSSINKWSKSSPTLMRMMQPAKPTNSKFQYRQLGIYGPYMPTLSYKKDGFEGVIRKDIMQWMLRNFH